MIKHIKPSDHQTQLPVDHLILKNQPETEESVPMDVIFVGAGPAGLSGAIELAKLIEKDKQEGGDLGEVEIAVLEKAASLGGHNLSGAVVNPVGFHELFPDLSIEDFPFKSAVKGEAVYFMTENSHFQMPTPPTMKNHGNQIGSICEMVRWLGEKAEGMGVNVFTSFPVDSLLTEDNKVVGVRTAPAGLNKDGELGPDGMPATDVRAKITVLSEGTRGPLTLAYQQENNIKAKQEQIYALGVKEIWKVPNPPEKIVHTMGWPLPSDAFGGSFLYPMGDGHVAIGLVVGLDYKEHDLDVHHLLQDMKEHPLFKQYLEGGELVEWGAKTIPEGGYHSIPKQLSGDGIVMTGDAVGFVNVPALKGIHYSMMSGIYAARAIFKALKAGDYTHNTLKEYDETVHSSFVMEELKKVRNMRQAFKDGFWEGSVKAGLMTVTGGAFPGDGEPIESDSDDEKVFRNDRDKKKNGISKVDAVYLSGNKTRDDIPPHLTVGKDITMEVADMYVHMCPAGVYEREGDKLIVNAPNCVDCKATDVLGPRWQPREGGSGPDYKNM